MPPSVTSPEGALVRSRRMTTSIQTPTAANSTATARTAACDLINRICVVRAFARGHRREDESAGRCRPRRVPEVLSGFRTDFYRCLTSRADALFELTDALLCTDGPVKTLVDLALAPEHRRGHGMLDNGLGCGRIQVDRLRAMPAGLPLPRAADGRIVLGVDVSPWLRSAAPTSPERLFCRVYGRAKNQPQLIPGWPYSVVAALEAGRTCWTAVLDAVRLGPQDDATAVTAGQLGAVVGRLIRPGTGGWAMRTS